MKLKKLLMLLLALVIFTVGMLFVSCNDGDKEDVPGNTEEPEAPNDPILRVDSTWLAYMANSDGVSCTVTGLGECEDVVVNIPREINGYTVTEIGKEAFSEQTQITQVYIPNTVEKIGLRAFYGCTGLTCIDVSSENGKYKSINGDIYSKNGKILIQYAIGKMATTFVVSNSVIRIGNSAFSGCVSLTDICESRSLIQHRILNLILF